MLFLACPVVGTGLPRWQRGSERHIAPTTPIDSTPITTDSRARESSLIAGETDDCSVYLDQVPAGLQLGRVAGISEEHWKTHQHRAKG